MHLYLKKTWMKCINITQSSFFILLTYILGMPFCIIFMLPNDVIGAIMRSLISISLEIWMTYWPLLYYAIRMTIRIKFLELHASLAYFFLYLGTQIIIKNGKTPVIEKSAANRWVEIRATDYICRLIFWILRFM